AGGHVALVDGVDDHLGPPTVAVAIAGGAVGDAIAVGSLQGHGLELGEFFRSGIEAQGPVGRRRPNLPLAVIVDGDRAAGRRHARRRNMQSIFSAFGSRRARPRRPALTSNQMMPFGSRVMPCVLAASPPGPFTLNILT